jgi:hypothetical protein
LVCLLLQRFKCTLGLGKGGRVSAACERFAHPLPSKPDLFGQALQRRQTEALVGLVGEVLPSPWERMGLFFALLQGDVPCLRAECARSAAARLIRQTLGTMLFPVLEPGRHGDTMALGGLGNVLDRRAVGTQEQTMGAAPGSTGGGGFHRGFSELTLFWCQRLPISHDHYLSRLYDRNHEQLCSVDEI